MQSQTSSRFFAVDLTIYAPILNTTVVLSEKLLSVCLGIVVLSSLSAQSLSEQLWKEAAPCHQAIEQGWDGEIQAATIIDDAADGYLKVEGSYPTCGCACGTTVGAYKDQKGQFTFLNYSLWTCDWTNTLMSNRPLKEVLPDKFSLREFAPQYKIMKRGQPAVFFLNMEIPQKGTDTKVSLGLVPFGMDIREHFLVYSYSEREMGLNHKSIPEIKIMAQNIQNPKSLELLMKGKEEDISAVDKAVMEETLADMDIYGLFNLRAELEPLWFKYELYLSVEYDALILGWDRAAARFFIKERIPAGPKKSFLAFLAEAPYFVYMC